MSPSKPKTSPRSAKRATRAPASRPSDPFATLDAWADAFQGVIVDERLHRAIGCFIVAATERRSLLDPFKVPLA